MHRGAPAIALLVVLLLGGPAARGDFLDWIRGRCGLPRCGCPDDYCRKPCPHIVGLAPYCGADDYCRKPCPWVVGLGRYCGADDYRRKPCPPLCWPGYPPFYMCGAPAPSCPAPQCKPACSPHGKAP
jgi:hypothetical protein